jgi:hypothetical protein
MSHASSLPYTCIAKSPASERTPNTCFMKSIIIHLLIKISARIHPLYTMQGIAQPSILQTLKY